MLVSFWNGSFIVLVPDAFAPLQPVHVPRSVPKKVHVSHKWDYGVEDEDQTCEGEKILAPDLLPHPPQTSWAR